MNSSLIPVLLLFCGALSAQTVPAAAEQAPGDPAEDVVPMEEAPAERAPEQEEAPKPAVDDEPKIETREAPPKEEEAEPKSATTDSAQDDLPPRNLTRSDYEEYAFGSIKACESILFPLTFIPGAGSAVGSVLDWGCVIPSAFTISHLSQNYSSAGNTFWPALLALTASKVYRSLVFYPVLGGIVFGAVLYVTGASAFFLLRDEEEFAAIGLAGLLTLGGAAFVIGRAIETKGAECVFGCIYFGLTKADKKALSKGEQAEARKRNGPVTGIKKGFNLFSIAAGTRPDGSLTTLIPIAGPLLRIKPKVENYQNAFRKAAIYDFGDRDRDLDKLDGTIKTVVYTEQILLSAAHGFLIAGGAAFLGGTLLFTLTYDENDRVNNNTALAAGFGVTGVVLAGSGLALIGIRELTQLAKPWLFSIQYKRDGNVMTDAE